MRLPADDLQRIVERTADYWPQLRGKRVFITGGTGFFGRWLLESFVQANAALDLAAELLVLSRNPVSFLQSAPHLAKHPCIGWLEGDVRHFSLPDCRFDYVIHGAMTTAAETFQRKQSALDKYDLVVDGSRRMLQQAVTHGVGKVLLLSSGPTYGRQPSEIDALDEDYAGAPLTTDRQFDFSVLGEAKRVAELLSTVYAEQHGVQVAIARCFSFVGPGLPLDVHYAIGNFIGDLLAGRPIEVQGDGRALRAYQYISDTMVWLWTLLLAPVTGLYNVGSDQACSIGELARLMAERCGGAYRIAATPGTDQPAARYVPSIRKAQQTLGLVNEVDLAAAIQKTLAFHRQQLARPCMECA